MEKGSRPEYTNRKRYILNLPDEVYKSLDSDTLKQYLTFQSLSRSRVMKEEKLIKLKDKINDLKGEIKTLEEKEETSYLKIQYLHNVYRCRVDVVRGLRKPKSLTEEGQSQISFKRNTHKGKPLTTHYVWNGKVYSSSLDGSKSIYFQTEERLKETLSILTGKDVNQFNPVTIKKFLKQNYTDFIRELMIKDGIVKFSFSTVKFSDFVQWYSDKSTKS